MKPYSMDLRERVLQDCDSGLPTQAVADKYRVSPAWLRRLKQRRRQTGRVAPRAPRRPPPVWTVDADRLRAAIATQPDLTLAELKARLGLTYSLATLWRATRALELTLKKKWLGRPNKTGPTSRPSVKRGGTGSGRLSRRG